MRKFFRRRSHTSEQGGNSGTCTNSAFLPISILVAAVLIAGAMVYSAERGAESGKYVAGGGNEPTAQGQQPQDTSFTNIEPVSKNDYIRGNKNAPIMIVEYSDLECPFCKNFHNTMKDVVEAYGDDVAWVYRHAPLDELHKNARKEAEAVECAGDLGGNDGFWAYMDRLIDITPSNDGLALSKLPEIAEYVGLNRAKFESCLASGKFAEKIQAQFNNVTQSGFRGTPYSVIVVEGTPVDIIPGALPFTLKNDPSGQKGVKEILDEILSEI